MATKAEVRDRAATDLGILRLGQALQSQDVTRIENAYAEVHAMLVDEGLAVWAYASEVPDAIVQPVVSLIADNCLNTYGVSEIRYQRIKLEASGAMAKIRKFVEPDNVTDNAEPDNF